jgi:signal transduction histidine kinase/CheY-like chemotaxis protein
MSNHLPQALRELGFVLLEYRGRRLFDLLSPPPPWFAELWLTPKAALTEIPLPEKSPFLENFLLEADEFWKSPSKGLRQSETWIEVSPAGKEVPLQAIALHFEGKCLLALHSPESQFQERTQLLQTARSSLLDHEKLQREIQKKEILLHCIIHDLSQPLSVMSVAFDCMADEQLTDRTKNMIDLGKKASDQQLAMIRDILQVFSADLKASLDSLSNTQSAPDLLLCAKSVVDSFAPVFAAKHVRLQLDESAGQQTNCKVSGEATRIERIFSNLLENALRYSPPDSQVTINLQQDGDFIKASVDDEGPSLPADLSPKQIFGLFSKGKQGGGKAGLGLYFCRLTVERWGGSIGCESLPHKGSRFWFRLPKAVVKPTLDSRNPVKPNKSPAVSSSVRNLPMRILLADDQEEIRMLTTHQLERTGHYVVAVSNGQEALDAISREPFDVILLDEDMPVMTGPQVLAAIRAQQKPLVPKPLIIALTGYSSDPDRERLLHVGFDSVIGKPFRMEALNDFLQSLSPPTDLPPTSERAAASPASTNTPIATLLSRVNGDETLARKMITMFLRDTAKRMAALQHALQNNDADSVASISHALQGSISIFGAASAVNYARQLQDSARVNDLPEALSLFPRLQEEIADLEANLRGYAGQKRSPGPGASSNNKRRSANSKRTPR